MPKLCVRSFGISIDDYGAGPIQDLQHPLGLRLVVAPPQPPHTYTHCTFQTMWGAQGGTTDLNDEYAWRGFDNIGA